MNNKNREHCKHIAETIEAIAEGRVYQCEECGEYVTMPHTVGEKYKCPHCETVAEIVEYNEVSIYDYMEGVYDIEYRIGSDMQYRSVKIMVACGGTNIYIDTQARAVRLYWWTDYAEYSLSESASCVIDDAFEELFKCR